MKARKVCLYTLLSLLLCSPAFAGIIYVTPTGPGPGGLSWATAFSTIQAGVTAAAAQPEKTVWVKTALPGSYSENVSVPDNIQVYGGFAGTEVPPFDYSTRDFITNETIVVPAVAATSIFTAGSATRIDGFTIKDGLSVQGAAIQGVGTGCAVAYCVIKDNQSITGAGIYSNGGALSASWCWFTDNLVSDTPGSPGVAQGGSIWVNGAALMVTCCQLIYNTAVVVNGNGGAQGGAIYVSSSPAVYINGCTFDTCVVTGSLQ